MLCFIDYRTTKNEKETLISLGAKLIEIPKSKDLYPAISGHPDIQINIIDRNKKKIIINRNLSDDFKKLLSSYNITYFESKNSLKENYPNNIILNSLNLDNFFIHNLKFTDPNLLDLVKNKKLINVKQGYTNCSVLKITENAFITSDNGIYKKLINENFDVLLIPPGDIILDGFDYGFIGGAGGLISNNTLVFFGSLDKFAYGFLIKEFLKKHNITPIYLSNAKLHDRGSILYL